MAHVAQNADSVAFGCFVIYVITLEWFYSCCLFVSMHKIAHNGYIWIFGCCLILICGEKFRKVKMLKLEMKIVQLK